MGGIAYIRAADRHENGSVPGSRMTRTIGAVARLGVWLAFAYRLAGTAAAANTAAPYPNMAPIDAYLMNRTQEIALAKSAAPTSVSKDASVLVLTRTGYATAITGTNGFVCWVARAFSGAFDWPERWNPKIRAAECQNPQAARTILPIAERETAMALAGRSTPDILDAIRTAVRAGKIPKLDSGAMSYMMSKSAYLTDQGGHDMPHVMFYAAVKDPADWGANAPDTPVIGGTIWFVTPGHDAEIASLPTLSVFISGVGTWSDGQPAPAHSM